MDTQEDDPGQPPAAPQLQASANSGRNAPCLRSTIGRVELSGPLLVGLCGECVNGANWAELRLGVPGVYGVQSEARTRGDFSARQDPHSW